MHRKSLFGRYMDLSQTNSSAERPTYARMKFEPLEDRKMLTVYFNDNWKNEGNPGQPLQDGDYVSNAFDTQNPGGIVGFYGDDCFGTGSDGSSVAGDDTLYDAINAATSGETLHIIGGSYTASDIVIDKPLVVEGEGTSGASETLITPETTSSGDQSNFGTGTRSGFIIFSPSVTIQHLTVDGSGNAALGAGLNYHQGITTLYDSQSGDYQSLHNGMLTPMMLGVATNNANESAPALFINDVHVNNTFWHGITLSPLENQVFDTGQDQKLQLTIRDAVVDNVGDVKDANRIGILLQNINDQTNNGLRKPSGNVQNATISNVGIGLKTAPWGDSPSYNSDSTATNKARVIIASVSEAAVYAYDLELASKTEYTGLSATWASPSNATGVYVNQGIPQLGGLIVTNAKIGIHVQNAPLGGGSGPRHPILGWGSTITGPGTNVAGSIGVLIDNDANEPNPANAMTFGDFEVTGYATGLIIEQNVAPPDPSVKNTVVMSDPKIHGNGTGVVVGNNSVLAGSLESVQSIQVTGTGQVLPTMYNWNPNDPYYYLNPGNSGGSKIVAPPKPDEINASDVTFGSGATYSPLLTGESGTQTLWDFNNAATYAAGALIPDSPVNGEVPSPYGALFNWSANGVITQDGGGQLVISGPATSGTAYDFLFGSNNHLDTESDPNNPLYFLEPQDLSSKTNIEVVMKLQPDNQARTMWFGLFDIRGNAFAYPVDLSVLNASTYTTLSFNLLTPEVNLTGPDSHFDMTQVAGYVFGGDQGYGNAMAPVPIHFDVDEIDATGMPNSVLKATSTVSLGGATLDASLFSGFVPSDGQSFTIIDNAGPNAVSGTFASLPEGSNVPIDGQNFTISYHGGDGNDVTLTKTTVVVPENLVIGQNIFYNGSKFDGSSAAVNDSDDLAIATDKTAYKAGDGVIGPSAMTSYAFGINGIMVDVVDGTAFENNPDAFTFKVATSGNDPSTWATAPAPSTVHVRTGKGADYMGTPTDRVEIIWDNFKITNQYLQVTVRGDDAAGGNYTTTALADSDVFYYGNIVADAFIGEPAGAFSVNTSDEIGARTGGGFLLPVTNVYDFNKDTIVNTSDEVLARTHTAFLLRINIPAAGPLAAPAAVVDDGSGSGVASALAVDATPATGPRLPGWISSRLAKVDLNSGPVANLFRHLAEADTPRSRAILAGADRIADALGLDDTLLDSLINDTDDDTSVG